MIFKFDETLHTDNQEKKHQLARCLLIINEKGHHIDRNHFYFSFVEREILVTAFIGQKDIDLIKSNHELYNVTTSYREDFRCILVGYGKDMCSPEDLRIILDEPSVIVVENERNDGSVIKRWAECYVDEDNTGDINAMVYEAFKDGRVRFLNAGGGDGTIVKRIEDQLYLYGNYPQYKITTVFDSDKNCSDDLGSHNHALKQYLDIHNFEYHCLIKREMENYFPINVYKKCGLLNENYTIPLFTEEDWDYIKIKEDNKKESGEQAFMSYEKRFLPELAKQAKKKHFKQRLRHQQKYNSHYGEIDEIQHVLLMIAKFI